MIQSIIRNAYIKWRGLSVVLCCFVCFTIVIGSTSFFQGAIILIFIGMLGFGLWKSQSYWISRYQHTTNALNKASVALTKHKEKTLNGTNEDLIQLIKLEEILNEIRHPHFQYTLRRYVKDVRNSTGKSEMLIQSPVDPSEYFTLRNILNDDHETLPNALPGVFMAVGLLGTFVGIAIGLSGISPLEVDLPSEDLMESVQTLLGGMSIAFITSITGIIFSIWWLFDFKFHKGRCLISLDKWMEELISLVKYENPHSTMFRLANVNESIRNSTTEIQRTSMNVINEFQNLGQNLAEALLPHLITHVGTPLQKLLDDFSMHRRESMQKIIEVFRETLRASIMDELEAFSKSIQESSHHWMNATREFESLFDRINSVSQAQTNLLERTTEIATVFDSGLQALTSATKAIESAGNATHDAVKASSEAVQASVGLREDVRLVIEVQEKLTIACQNSLNQHESMIGEVKSIIASLPENLDTSISEFQTTSIEKIRSIFQEFDSVMAQVVEHLSGTLVQLFAITEDFPDQVQKISGIVEKLADAVTTHQDTLFPILKTLEHGMTGIDQQFSPTNEELNKLRKTIQAASRQVDHSQDRFSNSMENAQTIVNKVIEVIELNGYRSTQDIEQLSVSIITAIEEKISQTSKKDFQNGHKSVDDLQSQVSTRMTIDSPDQHEKSSHIESQNENKAIGSSNRDRTKPVNDNPTEPTILSDGDKSDSDQKESFFRRWWNRSRS